MLHRTELILAPRFAPQVPIDWYEPFRAKMKELMPALARIADGSHVWWYSARMNEWLKDVDSDAMAAYAATMPAPTSTLGRRVVTCHGDFHAGNLVRDEVSTIRLVRPSFSLRISSQGRSRNP